MSAMRMCGLPRRGREAVRYGKDRQYTRLDTQVQDMQVVRKTGPDQGDHRKALKNGVSVLIWRFP